MERLLESVAHTTSAGKLECYHIFSGSVGIGKHRDDFFSMVDTAIELLYGRGGSRAQQLNDKHYLTFQTATAETIGGLERNGVSSVADVLSQDIELHNQAVIFRMHNNCPETLQKCRLCT
ncbi:hypothetical protein EJB05_57178, partial [Eragrostis curvula]